MNGFILTYGIQLVILLVVLAVVFFIFRKNTFIGTIFRESFLFLDLPKTEESLKNKDLIHYGRSDRYDSLIKIVERKQFLNIVLFTLFTYLTSFWAFYLYANSTFNNKNLFITVGLILFFFLLFFLFLQRTTNLLNKNETLLKNMNFLSTTLSTQNTYNTLKTNFFIYSALLFLDIIVFSITFLYPEFLGKQDNPLFVNIVNQFTFTNTFVLSWLVVLFEEFLFRFWLFLFIYGIGYQSYKMILKINQKAYINDAKKQKRDKTYFYLVLSMLLLLILSALFYIAHNTTYLSVFSSAILMLNSLWLTVLFIFWRRIETNILYHFCHNFFIFVVAICFTLSL